MCVCVCVCVCVYERYVISGLLTHTEASPLLSLEE